MRAAVVVALGCSSYVGPSNTKFVATPAYTKSPQIADRAITVRGTDSVTSAGGKYLGIVVADGVGSSVSVVRNAAWQAALIGGTHILLRESKVDRVDSSVATQHTVVRGGVEQSSIAFVPVHYDEIHAVFDVFRVEPDQWSLLHPQMRPTPRAKLDRP